MSSNITYMEYCKKHGLDPKLGSSRTQYNNYLSPDGKGGLSDLKDKHDKGEMPGALHD
jgi:hypothetical protein